jgi:pantoate--beta-alanine ligase
MIIARRVEEVRGWRLERSGSVGLVPTMGYLHNGHLSLVERARRDNDALVASLFVNPTQFGPTEDLASYPRDFERDTALLREAGCDLLFCPEASEIYPKGFETFVDVGSIAAPLEGERRPGHFRGVATVVLKLFGIVEPKRAYFGEKDAQQLAVIRKMATDLDLSVTIVACPTVREADGLAISSRNSYLTSDERKAAPVLYRALSAARGLWAGGERDAERLRAAMQQVLGTETLARADYVSVADPASLKELATVEGAALLSMAVVLGRARLIDNMRLEELPKAR